MLTRTPVLSEEGGGGAEKTSHMGGKQGGQARAELRRLENRGLGWSEASTVVATGRRRSVRVPGTHCLAGPQLTQTAAPQSLAAVLSSSSPYQGLPCL